jgi:hypothetical protein
VIRIIHAGRLPVAGDPITLSEIQRINKVLWREQAVLLEKGMADPVVRGIALEIMATEQRRGISVCEQLSIYTALTAAVCLKRKVLSDQGRKGGSAEKRDPLSKWLRELVRRDPQISEQECIEKLRSEKGLGLITDIDENFIYFATSEGKEKTAKLSGLKDRLSRARKELSSR